MRTILGGFLLVSTGMILSFLMVLRMIEPTFLLAFLAHAASFSGLALGFLAVLQLRRDPRSKSGE